MRNFALLLLLFFKQCYLTKILIKLILQLNSSLSEKSSMEQNDYRKYEYV